MSIENEVMALFEEGNPVPDLDALEPATVDAAVYLVTLEQRSSEMTQLTTKHEEKEQPSRGPVAWLATAAIVLVLFGVAILLLNQGVEEAPTATDPVPTTSVQPSTTIVESALTGIPTWPGSGNGQWVPAKSKIPYAFTAVEGWNSSNQAITEERLSLCPPFPGAPGSATCRLSSVAVLFLEPETIEETRDLLASFEGAELGEEQEISIDGAPGIRFEFTHDVAAVTGGQVQPGLQVPAAVDFGTEEVPLGQGPFGRSIVSIVDVEGLIVTLVFQGDDPTRGAPEDGFGTHREAGLAIIDSIIWGSP